MSAQQIRSTAKRSVPKAEPTPKASSSTLVVSAPIKAPKPDKAVVEEVSHVSDLREMADLAGAPALTELDPTIPIGDNLHRFLRAVTPSVSWRAALRHPRSPTRSRVFCCSFRLL